MQIKNGQPARLYMGGNENGKSACDTTTTSTCTRYAVMHARTPNYYCPGTENVGARAPL